MTMSTLITPNTTSGEPVELQNSDLDRINAAGNQIIIIGDGQVGFEQRNMVSKLTRSQNNEGRQIKMSDPDNPKI